MAGEVANKGQNFARLTHPDPLAPPPTPEIYTKVILNREKAGCARMCVPAAKCNMDAALRDPPLPFSRASGF